MSGLAIATTQRLRLKAGWASYTCSCKGLKTCLLPSPLGLLPEFLETEADYQNAPEGTIVASSGRFPWVKGAASEWACSGSTNSDFAMSKIGRRNVIRW